VAGSGGRWALAAWGLLLLLLLSFPQSGAANIIYVTTLRDEVGGTDGCSLKDAIFSSRFHLSIAIQGYETGPGGNPTDTPMVVSTQCVSGSGNDTIVLPPGQTLWLTGAVDASNYLGGAATPLITTTITIEGYGAVLRSGVETDPTIGPCACRLFNVGPTGHLTIRNTYVWGFQAPGGSANYNGVVSSGAGGGMGAGGAIYVQGGQLEIVNSTFNGNTAIGGQGGNGSGGGGGGLEGEGGGTTGSCEINIFQTELCGGAGGGGSSAVGAFGGNGDASGGPGGGGGGTLFTQSLGLTGGADCGGNSGSVSSGFGGNGQNAPCPGGGGGGGSQGNLSSGNGGNGNYGGGGGGGANGGGNGGKGGFGGGGGAGWSGTFGGTTGGDGGFGGGGGAGPNGSVGSGNAGHGGTFGGSASHTNGGGGAGLGGAIFSDSGSVTIENSTFTANDAVGGRTADPSDHVAGTGEGHGGAIFSYDGSLTILNSTIAGNLSSGSGGGVYYYQDPSQPTATFILRNTIIAGNSGSDDATAKQCTLNAAVITGGDWRGNLMQNDDPSNPCDYPSGSGTVSTDDPLLFPLQNYGGYTPTMAIGENSPAWNAADASTSTVTDQRGSKRPELGGFDIGAYELCDIYPTDICKPIQLCFFESLTIAVSLPAGGTTSPFPGTSQQCLGSVVSLAAIANPGYAFTGWSGNVSLPANASTVVVMAEPQNVTANFALCNCVVGVSSYVTVTRGPYLLNIATGLIFQTVTITNTSSATLIGPISLVLDSLSSNASLSNETGLLNVLGPPDSPYINAGGGNLAPGQNTSVTLQFTNPSRAAISYATRVLAGPGSR
jgi:hypothetical protein